MNGGKAFFDTNVLLYMALIVAAAEAGGAEVLFAEDLNDGQRYGTVTVRNPFQMVQPAH